MLLVLCHPKCCQCLSLVPSDCLILEVLFVQIWGPIVFICRSEDIPLSSGSHCSYGDIIVHQGHPLKGIFFQDACWSPLCLGYSAIHCSLPTMNFFKLIILSLMLSINLENYHFPLGYFVSHPLYCCQLEYQWEECYALWFHSANPSPNLLHSHLFVSLCFILFNFLSTGFQSFFICVESVFYSI